MRMRIAKIREARGISQERLGEMVGLSGASISRIETGVQGKTFERLQRIADALGVTPAELFDMGEAEARRAALIRLLMDLDPRDHGTAERILRGLAQSSRE